MLGFQQSLSAWLSRSFSTTPPRPKMRLRATFGQPSTERKNFVRTARYTILTFVPKVMRQELTRLANVYFLILAGLQCVPSISVTAGYPTLLIPMLIVLALSAAQEAYNDLSRHRCDRELNSQKAERLAFDSRGVAYEHEKVNWAELRMGNAVLVRNRETFPADLLLLASSRTDAQAMVETASLDGETNLKFRNVPLSLQDATLDAICPPELQTPRDIGRMTRGLREMSLEFDAPNSHIETFSGRGSLLYHQLPASVDFGFDQSNVLLRGCKLRNTKWAIGLIVHAGTDTKIFQNLHSATAKSSAVAGVTNELFVYILVFQFFLCVSFALSSLVRYPRMRYIVRFSSSSWAEASVNFFSWLTILCNMIPLALFFFENLCRIAESLIISNDPKMKCRESGHSAVVRSPQLNSDLGQVMYVFCDKTGTLTKNYMTLMKLCVGGQRYGESGASPSTETPHVALEDPSLRAALHARRASHLMFLLHAALNHSVLCEENADGGGGGGEYENDDDDARGVLYSASSPDEEALVYGAQHFGVALDGQCGSHATVSVLGQRITVEIVNRFEFSSDRKRSSVVCKLPALEDGWGEQFAEEQYVVFCKGADSVLYGRLKHVSVDQASITDSLNSYAAAGLRTICLACRRLSHDEYDALHAQWRAAALGDATDVDKAVANFESRLELQGSVGIEDQLATGVPDTIDIMRDASIKMWILTGDKLETAVNVAGQLRLLERDTRSFVVETASDLKSSFQRIEDVEGVKCALVIESEPLRVALEAAPKQLARAADKCEAVICCRTTPRQKAQVVQLMKDYTLELKSNNVRKRLGVFEDIIPTCILKRIAANRCPRFGTLAIGDGGNDCSMIQTADVGVGLRGAEGMQAFNVSDFGLSDFQHLAPLLLVHGRQCYRRSATLVLYTVYKVLLYNVPQILIGVCSLGFGHRFFFETFNQIFNVLTFLPPMVLSSVDVDVPPHLALRNPKLYEDGQHNRFLSARRFLSWMANGSLHGGVIFAISYMNFHTGNSPFASGQVSNFWITGNVAYGCSIAVICSKGVLEAHSSLIPMILSGIFSVLLFGACLAGLPHLSGTGFVILQCPLFYVSLAEAVALACFRDWLWKGYKRRRRPTLAHRLEREDIPPPLKKERRASPLTREMLFFSEPDRSAALYFEHLTGPTRSRSATLGMRGRSAPA